MLYFNFIIIPLITSGYNLMFKLIDRGVLEFFGSTSVSNILFSVYRNGRIVLESGALYAYGGIQLFFIFVLLLGQAL